jgi:Icc-related predicted phosphoesterase
VRLVLISDTHCHRGFSLPGGDVLIHAGDATNAGTPEELARFLAWFAAQPHRHRLLVAGNHDGVFQKDPALAARLIAEHPGITYLQDAGVEIQSVRFWGSPWQPWKASMAFNLPRKGERIRQAWNQIPMATDVLITHSPPHGILDAIPEEGSQGCEELRIRLATVRPRLHVFGHIHCGYGVAQSATTVYANASICGQNGQPTNRPIVVNLTPSAVRVIGTEPNPRQERLVGLRAAHEAAMTQPPSVQREGFRAALAAMADLRGLALDDLTADYLRRGFLSDLTALERAEAKPSNRPVPIRRVRD